MTTAKFIEMLKEADPDGTAHIRMSGGIPIFAELKEGYWDGPYTYLNEKDEFVYSIKGLKLDIHTTDIYDFVENNYEHGKTTWEEIKNKFKFELGGYSIKSQRDERAEAVLLKARKAFNDIYGFEQKMSKQELEEAKDRANSGWKWFQNKQVDAIKPNQINLHIYHTWVIVSPDGKEEKGSNAWSTRPILTSGLWEKLDNNVKEGYYEWVYK